MDSRTQFQNALAGRHVPAVEELRARPAQNRAGAPIVVAGNNALVARLRRIDGSDIALRIVAPGNTANDWGVRYHALADWQDRHQTRRIPGAIQVIPGGSPSFDDPDEGQYDAVAMEWIIGPTLAQAAHRATSTGKAGVLRALAAGVIAMRNDLDDLGLSHGDLTPDNLLVREDGHISCVDLDGATWDGAPLGPAGAGSPAYRPPVTTRDPRLRDEFATLVIVTSLHALADQPTLHRRYGDDPDEIDGGLLFSAWDLADPSTSEVFSVARNRASQHTRDLIDALEEACVGQGRDIEDAYEHGVGTGTPRAGPATSWEVGPVIERLRANQHASWPTAPVPSTWEPALQTEGATSWPLQGGTEPDAPAASPTSSPGVDELRLAIERRDVVAINREIERLGDSAEAGLYAADIAPILTESFGQRLLAAMKRHDDHAVVQLADEAETRHVLLEPDVRSRVRQARERLRVREKLETSLVANDNRRLAELAVSGELVVLGDADRESVRRVLQAIELPALQRAIQADDDHLIMAAYDQELFDDSFGLAAEVRDRIDLARARVSWLERARRALRNRDNRELRQLMVDPPEGVIDRLSAPERRRIRLGIERAQALDGLIKVLEGNDDHAIVTALNNVERVGARIPDRVTWQRIQKVVERESLIDELVQLGNAETPDHARVAQLVPAIKAMGLERDPRLGDGTLLQRMERDVVRMAHVHRIRAAITRDNDVAIITAALPDPHDAMDLLGESERDRVARAIRARRSFARTLT